MDRPQSILCPHCELPLDVAHDRDACRRRMSRRFFFALAVAPLVAAIAGKLPPAEIEYRTSGSLTSSDLQFMEWFVRPAVIAIAEKIEADIFARYTYFNPRILDDRITALLLSLP
jgi:hypothetical protein